MQNHEQYLSEAKFIPDLKLDVAYCLRRVFEYSDKAKLKRGEPDVVRESLYTPGIDSIFKLYVPSQTVKGKEKELIKHYQSVVDTAQNHGKQLTPADSYFWLRPLIFSSKTNKHISFPWYDTVAETEAFLNAIQSNKEGCIFNDMDQGWELYVYIDNEYLYFMDGSMDDERPYWCISANKNHIRAQAQEAQQRVHEQVNLLVKHFGIDYWNRVRNW